MPARDPRVRAISGRIGGTAKANPDADLTELRRELKAARAEEYARELVSSWPPLTDAQRATIAAVLAPASYQEAA